MLSRPPLAASRPVVLAALLAILLATSSLAASAVTTPTAPGDNSAHSTTVPGDQQPHSTTATCALGTTASTSSSARSNLSISTWTAPASAEGDFQTSDDIRQGIDSGLLTPDQAGANHYDDESIAIGDVLVHRIQLNGSSSDLLDRLDDQNQGTPTENFRSLVQRDDNGIEFRYIGPTACPPRLALNASIENGAFRVAADPETDALYLVVDVERLYFELGSSGPVADRWNWGHHAVSLTLSESSGLVAENTTIEDHYNVDRRRVEFETEDDSLVRFDPEPNQTVTGSASMAPGSVLEIELVPIENPNAAAAHTTNATLDQAGELDASFDLSNAPDSALYTLRIPDTQSDAPPRRLVAVGNATGASLGAMDHESIGTVLHWSGVTSTHGGFLVARNDTTTVAVSEYFGPGAASPQPDYDPLLWQDETLTLTVYHDTDGNEAFDPAADKPYRRGGEAVQATVNVTVDVAERETTTQTTSHPTTTTTSSTSTSPTTTTSESTASTTTTDGGVGTHTGLGLPVLTPGFDAFAAFIAIVGGGLLLWRR